jgi:DNA-binding transcriptional ArsR family regulator
MLLDDAPHGSASLGDVPRWELYRVLADPVRVRLLALVALEELAVGELAELVGEALPKVSRHAAALRDAGLVAGRRHGTSVLLRLASGVDDDAFVRDALRTGAQLVDDDGGRARIDAVLRARDARAREFFARTRGVPPGPPSELGAYLAALGHLLPRRKLAIDVGTGDGALLEALSPMFERVVAVDRSEAQLDAARARAASRGLDNVRFECAELDGSTIDLGDRALAKKGADVVFASRVLHHAPSPAKAVRALASLVRPATANDPGGALVVLDYAPHDDVAFKEAQADLWLGFSERDLLRYARDAGLEGHVAPLPAPLTGDGPDKHLGWQVLVARPSQSITARRTNEKGHAS